MLHITTTADDAIRSLVRCHGLETGGLRISLVHLRSRRAGLALSVVDTPSTSDHVIISAGGSQVYVEQNAVEHVRGLSLDAKRGPLGYRFAMQPHTN